VKKEKGFRSAKDRADATAGEEMVNLAQKKIKRLREGKRKKVEKRNRIQHKGEEKREIVLPKTTQISA